MEANKYSSRGSFPTLGDLLALFGLIFVIQIGVTLVATLILFLSGNNPATLSPQAQGGYLAATSLLSMVGAVIAFFYYGRIRKAPLIEQGITFRRFNPMLLLWGYLALVALGVVIEPLYNLLPPLEQPIGSGLWAAVAVIVIAPCFEELLCRGWLYGWLRTRYGRWPSMLLSALFFGLLHLQPIAVINAFLIGMLLAYLYDMTATLWAPILLHALNNATAFLLLQAGYEEASISQLFEGHPYLYAAAYLAALVLLGLTLYQLYRSQSRPSGEKNTPSM